MYLQVDLYSIFENDIHSYTGVAATPTSSHFPRKKLILPIIIVSCVTLFVVVTVVITILVVMFIQRKRKMTINSCKNKMDDTLATIKVDSLPVSI